jgi:hypothetical protein
MKIGAAFFDVPTRSKVLGFPLVLDICYSIIERLFKFPVGKEYG